MKEGYKNSETATHESPITRYCPDTESSEVVASFIDTFPTLPAEPREAFVFIQTHLIEQGFEYDSETFLIADVIKSKKGNCLGLCILFGSILERQGFRPTYEVVVAPHDAHHAEDLKQFDRLTRGEVFDFDNPPDLPNEKAEFPQNWFLPLEHPVILLDGARYETTSLLMSEDASVEHNYDSESARPVVLENLIGSMFASRAKMDMLVADRHEQYSEMKSLVNTALELWPGDRQTLFVRRNLAMHHFDDETMKASESELKALQDDDSLFQFSMYEMTGDETYLDEALKRYPPYIEAFVRKRIRLPIDSEEKRREAKFDFTVASVCVANSSELDLDQFYLRHIDLITEIFGKEYTTELLFDLEIDNKWPTQYLLSLFRVTDDTQYLITAIKQGVIEEATPLESLHICSTVISRLTDDGSEETESVRQKCRGVLDRMQARYEGSDLFHAELAKL